LLQFQKMENLKNDEYLGNFFEEKFDDKKFIDNKIQNYQMADKISQKNILNKDISKLTTGISSLNTEIEKEIKMVYPNLIENLKSINRVETEMEETIQTMNVIEEKIIK
jgi:uncharacterized membrane-anchored protein YjiN (DUF445 family)